jgi:hypothetical protein
MLPRVEWADTGTDDQEVCALRAEYDGRWHVTRTPTGALDFALEPRRGYHIVALDAGSAARSIVRYERDGCLFR